MIFFISGLTHALTDVAEGYSWQQQGSVQYFCTQVVGIMLEDGVQAIYNAIRGTRRNARHQPERWTRLVGYVWVLAFQV